LFEIIKDGGPMMYPLFLCSFITLVFVFERAISLRRGRVIPRPFVKRLLHQVREGIVDREGALELCEESGSPVATVFAAAARKWGRPSVELEQTIIDAGDRVAGSLRRYVRLFNAVATISPLMGLLGTVFGMIRLFAAISSADAMGRTELLASGISEALLTTASGLVIAIPAVCFYVLFASKVERLLLEIDEHAQELGGLISAEALHDERQSKLRGKSRPPAAA
jgi:biopolymer transport protein ExbB